MRPPRLHASHLLAAALIALAGLAGVAILVGVGDASVAHAAHGTGNDLRDEILGQASPISVDGDPIDEILVAPVTPRDCWREFFPYKDDRNKAVCVDP